MGGLVAAIRFDGKPLVSELLDEALASIAYRGPDGIHERQFDSCCLAHLSMATLPEQALLGPQIVVEEDLAVVMDGHFEDCAELANRLGAERASEGWNHAWLLLLAYRQWGRECFAHLDGDFAVCIVDRRNQEVLCARDALGTRPLLYHFDGCVLAVASEPGALLRLPWVERRLNAGVVAEFLSADWRTRGESLWEGVRYLLGGHALSVSISGLKIWRWWKPEMLPVREHGSEAEAARDYYSLLERQVALACRTHLPLAMEVSGGLDSSALFAMAVRLQRAGRLQAPALHGFTLCFGDGSAADEIGYAREVGAFVDYPIRECVPSFPTDEWYGREIVETLHFPGYPNGQMFFGIRSEAREAGARVLVTGEGGDEWLRGSFRHLADSMRAGRLHGMVKDVRALARDAGWRMATHVWLRDGVLPAMPRRIELGLLRAWRKLRASGPAGFQWLSAEMQQHLDQRIALGLPDGLAPGRRELWEALTHPLGDHLLARNEVDAARKGLELRYPMRSRRFVEAAFRTPESMRLHGGYTKWLHRVAMEGVLPATVQWRRDKAEFSGALTRRLPMLERYFCQDLPGRRGAWLDPDGVRRLYREAEQNGFTGREMWALWSIRCIDLLADR